MAGTSYTRQSTIADGNIITAALFNNEFNQILNAFAYASSSTTGHQHDGSASQGGNIPKIGDQDFLNKIEVDSTNNRIGLFVEVSSVTVEQVRIQDGAIVPVTDSDVDLGTTSVRFKDAFVDSATVTGTVSAATVTSTGTTNIVIGVVTGDFTLTGAAANVVWDSSENTLEFADDAYAAFGASDDLLIYHDGTNSYIKEQGTGNLYLRADASILMGSSSGATSLTVTGSSGVTLAASGATKLTVDSGGVNIPDSVTLNIGSSDDLQIYHDGSNSYIKDAGTGNLNIQASTDVFIGTTATTMANFDSGGSVDLYYNNTKKFETTSDGATISGNATVTGAVGAQTFNASSSIDTPQIEVTTLKARDGSAAGSIADSTGVVTLGSAVLTTADINGGTADNVVIGGSTAAAGSFTTVTASGLVSGTDLTLDDASPTITITDTDGTNTFSRIRQVTGSLKLESRNDTGHGAIEFETVNSSLTKTRFKIGANGDANFYDDDGTTIGLKFDASEARLGIGTTSPATALDVAGKITTTEGIYLGGTGSANLFDDYEEGTWTPTYQAVTTNPAYTEDSHTAGRYTKVGNVVHAVGRIRTDSATDVGSGQLILTLPFTVSSSSLIDKQTGVLVIGEAKSFNADYFPHAGWAAKGTQQAYITRRTSPNGLTQTLDSDDALSTATDSNDLVFSITYLTDS